MKINSIPDWNTEESMGFSGNKTKLIYSWL